MLDKYFNYKELEQRWYETWLSAGYFKPDLKSKKPPFCIAMPPPNVTGILHMGHGLDMTLPDTLIRFKRMKGFNTFWVPGTDHAGIATQNVVEKELRREGKKKEDLGREAFIDLVWKWKEKHHHIITDQIKKLGASCDWSRERFTLDEGLSRAVTEVFVRLYSEGLIYRGERITNWCARCHTALSDLEVIPKETKGGLYHILYPFADGPLPDGTPGLVVATTRPETMLGDTAVAVNPQDNRYRNVVGKKVILPLLNKPIPIIADPYVDIEFGTGALKITPGHDFNDFEIGNRHSLEIINIFNKDGTLNENAGPYRGLDIVTARTRVMDDLNKGAYLKKEEEYTHSVGRCQRCDTVAEPMVTTQWFVRVGEMAKAAQVAVDGGKTAIIPSNWKKTWDEWLNNIRDWCISRQLWWGHRIPAYYCKACGTTTVERARPSKCGKCGKTELEQDPDVLDTWFSSALWPFSTLGWPDQTPELKIFYPTSVMVTGFDIIFFWVARMMMTGIKFMRDVPFREIYLHALVLDAGGKKMSKSSGNALDPMVMTEKFGTDAFRFCMVALSAQGRNIKLSEDKIEGYRNFVNKIWNASKLVLSQIRAEDRFSADAEAFLKNTNAPLSLADRYILYSLEQTTSAVTEALEHYDFDVAASKLYTFFWYEFCDWYLEAAKFAFYDKLGPNARNAAVQTAVTVLEQSLRLLHPPMPFVSEEIWQSLPAELRRAKSIMIAEYPSATRQGLAAEFKSAHETFVFLTDVVTSIRNVRGEHVIAPGKELQYHFLSPAPAVREMLETNAYLVEGLAKCRLHIVEKPPQSSFVARVVISGHDTFIDLEGIVDREKETTRLEKELAKVSADIERAQTKLGNTAFVERAPAELIEKEREKQDALLKKKLKLSEAMNRLQTP